MLICICVCVYVCYVDCMRVGEFLTSMAGTSTLHTLQKLGVNDDILKKYHKLVNQ